jgi:hypothetical protein
MFLFQNILSSEKIPPLLNEEKGGRIRKLIGLISLQRKGPPGRTLPLNRRRHIQQLTVRWKEQRPPPLNFSAGGGVRPIILRSAQRTKITMMHPLHIARFLGFHRRRELSPKMVKIKSKHARTVSSGAFPSCFPTDAFELIRQDYAING